MVEPFLSRLYPVWIGPRSGPSFCEAMCIRYLAWPVIQPRQKNARVTKLLFETPVLPLQLRAGSKLLFWRHAYLLDPHYCHGYIGANCGRFRTNRERM
jgi:hypothetical protein